MTGHLPFVRDLLCTPLAFFFLFSFFSFHGALRLRKPLQLIRDGMRAEGRGAGYL